MSLICHARKLLQTIPKIQQSAQISTTPIVLSSCGNRKCPRIKVAGCAPRIRFDCEPIRKRRCKCVRIDVPEPSYSECFRCPPPTHRMTECPDCSIKGLKPPKHCIKRKLGITIDGCNPRESVKMLGSCRPRNKACKKCNKPCGETVPLCDPCIQPFKSYEPCSPPPRRPEKSSCYAPKQDCDFDDVPACSSCQVKPSCQKKPAKKRQCPAPPPPCPVMLPPPDCIDPDKNCIDPQPPCGSPDPACELRNPCKAEESICCSKSVCNFRMEPKKRDAALGTCRSCSDVDSGIFSSPPNCPVCGSVPPPSCPMCGERMDDCGKKSSMLDSLWGMVQRKK